MITLRASRPEDVERLFEIWRDAVDATHTFLSDEDRAEIARIVRDDYVPVAEFIVAVDGDDRPLAFMGMTGNNIDALFIDPAVHRQGLGRMMIECAAREGRPLTVDVNEQNEGAVGFYRAMAFVETGRSATDDQGRPYPLLHMRRA